MVKLLNHTGETCNHYNQLPYNMAVFTTKATAMYTHPEIEELLNSSYDNFIPNAVMLQNAEVLLNYIDDINLERTATFELTPAESLYLVWNAEDLEFHMECLSDGRILYTFRKGGFGRANGCLPVDKFIPLLQDYLLMSIW